MSTFIECSSLSVSYDITGIATVSYTIMSNEEGLKAYGTVAIGGMIFTGYVTSAVSSIMPRTEAGDGPWYQTQVTLLSIAEAG